MPSSSSSIKERERIRRWKENLIDLRDNLWFFVFLSLSLYSLNVDKKKVLNKRPIIRERDSILSASLHIKPFL